MLVPPQLNLAAKNNQSRKETFQSCRRAKSSVAWGTNFGGDEMLWTLFVVLLVLWLLGVVSSYTLGGFIHILLVLAVVALIFQLISGRRTAV
jgi:Family of unknown function (DUF5670)